MAAPMQCVCHILDTAVNEALVLCSDKSWAKLLACVNVWKTLDGLERHVADNFVYCVRENAAYHRSCYQRFTAKNRLEQGLQRGQKGKLKPQIVEIDETLSSPPTKRRIVLRSEFSENAVSDSSFSRRSIHVLPEKCIICCKNKTVIEKATGKRNEEKLVTCETDAGKILEAARLKNDERILVQIGNFDPVCIELRYHSSCYKNYIKCLYHGSGAASVRPLSKSFKKFCTDIVEERIVSKGEVIRMNTLRKIFVKIVQETEAIDITHYRNFQLKDRLIVKYSDKLQFVRPDSSSCELVLCKDDSENTFITLDCDSSETEDSTSSCESDFEIEQSSVNLNQEQFAQLYRAALIIRQAAVAAPGLTAWPPKAEHLSNEDYINVVPTMIFNFLTWCCNLTDDFSREKVSIHGDDNLRKILSIGQDLISLTSQGRKLMPKHVALGMTLRNLTGSAKLQQLVNSFGHCVSHSVTLEHDTALATQQLQRRSDVPDGFHKNMFTTLVWDNNDFGEETLTGKGTTHNTNGIIIQRVIPGSPEVCNIETPSMERDRKRTIEAPVVEINHFHGKKRSGPVQFRGQETNLDRHMSCQEEPRRIDMALMFAKYFMTQPVIPGWTGCHQLISREHKPVQKIGYLPVIDASPTDKSTVNTILEKSLNIAKNLDLNSVVLVMDQAIYAKAQEIRWQSRPELRQSIILRLGEFHTAMAYLGTVGKRFDSAGLRDIAIESGLVAEGSINGVMSGHHYNRSMRCHKIIYEALKRLQIQDYLSQLSSSTSEQAASVMQTLYESFPDQFVASVNSEEVSQLLMNFNEYVDEKCRQNAMYAFWTSYLQMVELLLIFVKATREGNWHLHLSTVRDMLPWFFAYGRINYARYLPVYYLEMKALPTSHPSVYANLVDGQFAVKRHENHPFSLTACDQIIEQTFNRDSKTKGGMTGITLNKGAVSRWILSYPDRAAITNACYEMSNSSSKQSSSQPDLVPSRRQTDEQAIREVMETVSGFSSPFTHDKDDEIINLSSGQVAPEYLKENLCSAYKRGEESLKQFVGERLCDGKVDIFDKLSLPTGITFADVDKKGVSKASLTNAALKERRYLFARLLLVAQEKDLDLEDALKYNLSSVPPAIANLDSTIVKTNKATLLHHLEGYSSEKEVVHSAQSVFIVDAMALIQKQRQFPETFGQFAVSVLKQMVTMARKHNSKRIDFVVDRYLPFSIKQSERNLRSKHGETRMRITRSDQKMPKQMKKFLACNENKESLLQFLVEEWKKCSDILCDIQLYANYGEECVKLYGSTEDVCGCDDVPNLHSDHEEADTRMFLHVLHASHSCTPDMDIIIHTVDTDVVILALWASTVISCGLIVHLAVGNSSRVINVKEISNSLGTETCEALLGIHPFTGCDTVSAFKGKGKVKAFKLMLSSPVYKQYFSDLGKDWSVSNELYHGLEKFVCDLYGWTECDKVNTARYNSFRFGNISDISMPPSFDSLTLHTQRANYQARIYRCCMQQHISALSPDGNGWKTTDNRLQIQWTTLPIAPASVLLVHEPDTEILSLTTKQRD